MTLTSTGASFHAGQMAHQFQSKSIFFWPQHNNKHLFTVSTLYYSQIALHNTCVCVCDCVIVCVCVPVCVHVDGCACATPVPTEQTLHKH